MILPDIASDLIAFGVGEDAVCGSVDDLTGAQCTREEHSDVFHSDLSDPSTEVRWKDYVSSS